MKKNNFKSPAVSLVISEYPSQLDHLVREKFNDSLRYLFSELHNEVPFSKKSLDLMSEHILSHRVTPRAFSQFYNLVFDINQMEKGQVKFVLEKIISLVEDEVNLQVLPYLETVLGDEYLLFPKLIFTGFAQGNPMVPANETLINRYEPDVHRAIEIIQLVDADVYGELMALISLIIFCDKNPDEHVRAFGGASSLMAWGALFLNTQVYFSLEDIITGLIHEATHTALFGVNEQETLVLNPIDKNFTSPLRSDERPMDGIYHATIVSARVSLFLRKIRDNAVFQQLDKERILVLEQHSNKAFYSGLETISEHAVLSNYAQVLIERFTGLMNLSE